MLKNYLIVAFRNLIRSKLYSVINIAGLAVGMTCAILILLWVQNALSYDQFHPNAREIYRIEEDQHYADGTYHVNVTPYPVGPAFKEEIPEVVDATRYAGVGGLLFRAGDKAFYEGSVRAVDPSFFRMFAFPFVKGDAATALETPFSVVISERMAEKYFADVDPMGKTLSVNNHYTFTVTGVMAPMPRNSYFRFQIALPIEFMRELGRWQDHWGSNNITTLVQLRKDASVPMVNQKMTAQVRTHLSESTTDFVLAPFTGLHLHAYFGFGHSPGNVQYVYIFSAIAVFVLLIACINFMNLSTAQSEKRAREIGLRKVVGASRGHLVRRFLGESMLLSCLALVIALPLVELLMEPFNELSGKRLVIDVWHNWPFALGLIVIVLLTGLISGSYPALFLSGFQPVQVLKGRLLASTKGTLFRKVLVVMQFALSVILIIGTGIVYRQLHFMQSKELGYNKEQVLYIRLRSDVRGSYETLKNQLKSFPGIINVTAAQHLPSNIGSNSSGARWDGKDPDQNVPIGESFVDFDFVETLKIEMAEGRSFSSAFPTDQTEAFLVNEEVVKLMGVDSGVGQNFEFMGRKGKIIGVMKNFHFYSVRREIGPLALMIYPDRFNYILIRLAPDAIPAAIGFLEQTWATIVPDYPLEYQFLDRDFERMYRAEERMGNIMTAFAVVAVFIACLGLFGMASFMAERRAKEIGVRKVLGASVAQVVVLLTRDFTKWVLLATLIAWPVAGYLMQQWLQGFAYRVDLTLDVFALAGLLALVIAILTVSYQAIRVAQSNPVDALRDE